MAQDSPISGPLSKESLLTGDLMARRQAIRQGLVRSNTATLVALLISVGLAMATIFYSFEAQRAKERMREELWNSQRAQARALRLSAKPGRRHEGLKAIAEAVRIRPSAELRDEAIATLPLVDVQPGSLWNPLPPEDNILAISTQYGFYAAGDNQGKVSLRRLNDQVEIGTLMLSNRVMCMEFSSDGRWLAAFSQGGSISLWDATTRQTVWEKKLPPGEFNEHAITFSPDCRQVAVCTPELQVRIFQTRTGEEQPHLPVEAPPAVAQFDSTGRWLAVGAGNRIQIWDVLSRQRIRILETQVRILDLAWHPITGHFALAANDGCIVMASPEGTTLSVLRGHTALVNRVLFDPSGGVLISTSWDGTTRFWSAQSGWPLLVSQAGFARQFDSSGQRLYYVKEGIGFGDWFFSTGTAFRVLALPREALLKTYSVDFSPDDRWLAVAAKDGVHIMDVRNSRLLGGVKLANAPGAAFTDDGKGIVISSAAGVHRVSCQPDPGEQKLDLGELAPVPGITPGPYELGFTTRGARNWFVTGNASNVAIVDLSCREKTRVWPIDGRGSSIALSPDGQFLVTSVWKGAGTRVWPMATAESSWTLGDEGGIAKFSPDGRWLVVGTGQRFVLYKTDDWRMQWERPRDTASALSGVAAFNPDGQIMAVTHTLRQVHLIETATGQLIATLDAPIPERVTTLCFSRNGSLLAAGTSDAGVQLWNLDQLRRELRGLGLEMGPEGAITGQATRGSILAASPQTSLAWWLSSAGSGLALLFAWYSIRHHRQLVQAYQTVEMVAEKRRQEVEETQYHLVHSQKMKALGTLAAGMAHDFNNLLSIIRMSGQLVRRQLNPAGPALHNLEAIERAVAQGKRIVGSILGYTRCSNQPLQFYKVSTVVNDTLAMLNAHYLGGLTISLDLQEEVLGVCGDKSRLEQILLNLIVNAYEAMKGAGRLAISVKNQERIASCILPPRAAKAYVELKVQDSGPGIDPKVLPRIFEPFFTTKTGSEEHGTGLGLTTVYSIARQDGFGLNVESTLRQGTSFLVIIPIGEEEAKMDRWAPLAHGH